MSFKGGYHITAGTVGDHSAVAPLAESSGLYTTRPMSADVGSRPFHSSALRIVALLGAATHVIMLTLATNLSWWSFDFQVNGDVKSPPGFANARCYGRFTLYDYWQCTAQPGPSPPYCEVYANTDLADTSFASVQAAVSVIRPVLSPGSTNALLVLAIIASALTLLFAAAPVGWGEYKEGAASVSAAFEGNTGALQLLAAGHGATAFFILVGLSIYQSHASTVDQAAFLKEFYYGLTMNQVQGNPSSLMSLGPGRQMAVAVCVLASLWCAAALVFAWRYRTRGFAAAQESVWLRYLPRAIRSQLPA